MSSVRSRSAPPGNRVGDMMSRGAAIRVPQKWRSLTIAYAQAVSCRQERVVRQVSVNHDAALDPGLLEEGEGAGREMTKLQRAHDGCLGDRRRRRTWVAAKSVGEPLTRL